MTVAELIARLKQLPLTAPVLMPDPLLRDNLVPVQHVVEVNGDSVELR